MFQSFSKSVCSALTAALITLGGPLWAQSDAPPQTLFINVNIFDGTSDTLAMNKRVLVEGNLIKSIGDDTLKANSSATVIDGGGRTLMPGMIETHAHLVLTGANLSAIEAMDWGQIAYSSVPMAEMYLMEGFTTVRDAGGGHGCAKRPMFPKISARWT